MESMKRKYAKLLKKAQKNDFKSLDKVLDKLKSDSDLEALEVLKWIATHAKMPESTLVMGSDRRDTARYYISKNFSGTVAVDALIETAPKAYHFENGYMPSCLAKLSDEELLRYRGKLPVCTKNEAAKRGMHIGFGDLKKSILEVKKRIADMDLVKPRYRVWEQYTSCKEYKAGMRAIHDACMAIGLLGHSQEKRAVALLMDVFNVQSLDIHHAVGVAMGRIGTDRAKDWLLEEVSREPTKYASKEGVLTYHGIAGCIKGLCLMDWKSDPSLEKAIEEAIEKADAANINYAGITCGYDSSEEQRSQQQALEAFQKRS
jgi:hypothetical protein